MAIVWRGTVSCLVIYENFWYSELRYVGHAAGVLAVHVVAEAAAPVHGIEESDDNVSPYRFVYSLESGSPTEEFVKSEILVSRPLVMRNLAMTYLKLLLSLITL